MCHLVDSRFSGVKLSYKFNLQIGISLVPELAFRALHYCVGSATMTMKVAPMTINDSGADNERRDALPASLPVTKPSVNAASASVARRQMIASALAAVPVVLTITAGVAKAQGVSMESPGSSGQDDLVEEDSQTLDEPQSKSSSTYSTDRNESED
jgi:hypothetical protein